MKTYERWLSRDPAAPDPLRCPVCGHRSLPRARRQVNRVLLMLLGIALAYIALDVASDGRLDGSLYQAIRAHVVESRSR
jgi:hypothetical protein